MVKFATYGIPWGSGCGSRAAFASLSFRNVLLLRVLWRKMTDAEPSSAVRDRIDVAAVTGRLGVRAGGTGVRFDAALSNVRRFGVKDVLAMDVTVLFILACSKVLFSPWRSLLSPTLF